MLTLYVPFSSVATVHRDLSNATELFLIQLSSPQDQVRDMLITELMHQKKMDSALVFHNGSANGKYNPSLDHNFILSVRTPFSSHL